MNVTYPSDNKLNILTVYDTLAPRIFIFLKNLPVDSSEPAECVSNEKGVPSESWLTAASINHAFKHPA